MEAGVQGLGMPCGRFELEMSESPLRSVEQTAGYTGLRSRYKFGTFGIEVLLETTRVGEIIKGRVWMEQKR